MTLKEAKIYIQKELSDYYPKNEIESFIKIIFSDVFDLSSVDVLMKENETLPRKAKLLINEITERLKTYEPLQYIIGFTEFYGLQFKLSPDVLIPRPETEELVDLILKEYKDPSGFENPKGLQILDIGTGSGCIAVSLAKNLPSAEVFALDISSKALETAKSNALKNNIEVTFIQEDILNDFSDNVAFKRRLTSVASKRRLTRVASKRRPTKFDIIVSNPPYVTFSEKEKMQKNVLDYEPELALFVEDDNPLIFYNAVCRFARHHLSSEGKLYFEINEQYGKEIKTLLLSSGFSDVEIIKDINGKDRIVKGRLI